LSGKAIGQSVGDRMIGTGIETGNYQAQKGRSL
jgi:hypothetical protein